MYRNSKLRTVSRAGGNVLVALVTLGSGVAIATTIAHRSPTGPAAAVTSTTTAPVSTTARAPLVALAASTTPVSGIVTGLSGTSISIRTSTGTSSSYSVGPTTIVMQGRAKTTLASVHVGTRVFVVPSSTNPSVATAIGIVAVSRGEGTDGGSESSDGN